jgi:glutathione reductase (NADPH)
VTVFEAFARLTGANGIALSTLNADGSPGHQELTAKHILIATGGTPHVPHFVGREHVITSNEIFDLEPFPQRLVVVGGGYIASEFASIFNGLGSKVTQLYRGEQILRGFDDEIRQFVSAEMVKAGVNLHLNAGVVDVRKTDEGLRVECEGGALVMADAVLYATGRVPNVADMGLQAVGVAQGAKGEILVNDRSTRWATSPTVCSSRPWRWAKPWWWWTISSDRRPARRRAAWPTSSCPPRCSRTPASAPWATAKKRHASASAT